MTTATAPIASVNLSRSPVLTLRLTIRSPYEGRVDPAFRVAPPPLIFSKSAGLGFSWAALTHAQGQRAPTGRGWSDRSLDGREHNDVPQWWPL